MKEIQQHLEEAFRLISSIPVKGDFIDIMAVARNNLRTAYRLLDEKKESRSENAEGPEEVSSDG